ncbi:MAG: hypothetical protein MJA27_06930 [Pseudanabaenales cyanobacterium]|nr:hypothetical protein [Pseudanabaenales cyanobacterium]
MDSGRLAGLTAELKGQLQLLNRVADRLQQRVAAGLDTPGQLDSVAYQIHNAYCAAEDLLKLVAHAFENRIGAGGEWHRTLLLRLSQPLDGVRPAFISEETFTVMNVLRGFRHFVRHGYGAEIEVTQLQVNLQLAQRLPKLLAQDTQVFLRAFYPDE